MSPHSAAVSSRIRGTPNGLTAAHQTGFTATFTPNTVVPYPAGGAHDIDFNSAREGKTNNKITYAVVTSRSYHPGGVHILLADGSSRFVADKISLGTWQALATRSGAEIVEDY